MLMGRAVGVREGEVWIEDRRKCCHVIPLHPHKAS